MTASPLSWPISTAPSTAHPPAYATPRTPERPTYGPAAGALAKALGKPFLPWQQQVADVALETLPDGSWAYRTVVITTPRQAGKTTLLAPVFTHRGLTEPGCTTWLTAQSRQDARNTWLKMVQLVRASSIGPRFDVRLSNGGEALVMPGGSTFGVFAPAENALHGTTNAAVAIDEAWAVDAAMGDSLEQAIRPTFSTTGGQWWLVSTAGTADKTWFRSFVDAGRAAAAAGDTTGGVCYLEWSLPDDQLEVVSRGLARAADPQLFARAVDLVEAAHPAGRLTLRRDALEDSARTMGRRNPAEFLRAYGNRWTEAARTLIPGFQWATCKATSWPAPEPGKLALSFDVAPDRSDASIGAAWRGPDGLLRIDVIDHRSGAAWLPDRLAELAATWKPLAIAHDPAGPSPEVADQLRRQGIALTPMTGRDQAVACASMLSAIQDVRLFHAGAPSLDRAVAVVATKPRGDGFVWARRASAGSISPLAAVTQAAWAFDHRPAPVAAARVYSRKT